MKKFYLIFAALCFAVFSCAPDPIPEEPKDDNQEEVTPPGEGEGEGETPGEGEGETPGEGGNENENPDENLTVFSTQGQINWTLDDEIRILYADKIVTAKPTAAGTATTFTLDVEEADAYYAVYPSSVDVELADAALKLSIPATQDVTGGTNLSHYAVAKAIDDNFAFKSVCGWLKFTISDPAIKRVLVRGNGGQNISGDVTVTFDATGEIAETTVTEGADLLIVDVDGAGDYYVAVLPQVNLENGVAYDFYSDHSADADKLIASASNSDAVSVDRGEVTDLGDICSLIVTGVKEWYISPEGTGDGKTETSPANGVEFLRSMLTQDGDACHGITIHAAAGEYDFEGQEIEIAWADRTAPVRTTIEGAGETTIFTNTGVSRFFNLGKYAALTLNNMKITGGNADADSGGAVLMSDETAELDVDNCLFEGNYAAKGGVISIVAANTLRLNNCIITGNSSLNYAAGILVDAPANVYMNACSVFGNSNRVENKDLVWGPAIFVNKVAANLCINNCTFGDHSTAYAGNDTNIDVQGGNLVFANSTMLASTTAGMLRVHTSGNNGTFINSVIINKNSVDASEDKFRSINFNSSKGTLVSQYVISGVPQNKYKNEIDETNKKFVTYADLGSPAFDTTDNIYKWDGSLTGCPAAPAASAASALIETADADFHAWLTSINALDVDQLGNSRSTNRQGAYCGK